MNKHRAFALFRKTEAQYLPNVFRGRGAPVKLADALSIKTLSLGELPPDEQPEVRAFRRLAYSLRVRLARAYLEHAAGERAKPSPDKENLRSFFRDLLKSSRRELVKAKEALDFVYPRYLDVLKVGSRKEICRWGYLLEVMRDKEASLRILVEQYTRKSVSK